MSERDALVLGQRYAYATAALTLGVMSYVHLLGMEKALAAVFFAWLALRRTPGPALQQRRRAAITGMALGVFFLIAVPVTLALHREQLLRVIEALKHQLGR